ncbi:sulfoacetaldehyde dehydrogenase (acylating) [mine drainage metagenome]|uniref:Sulfoacetaldehyde dehydrogenase (Acylating) n=1 Tax=mine drainage metagenome TaxID=410659 RepID=A0A1J5R6R4_9ZZZZ
MSKFETPLATSQVAMEEIGYLIATARQAQKQYQTYTQEKVDDVCLAAGWAIMESGRNQQLAELAVKDTGLGNVPDKITKNYRKTLGLLRDLSDKKSVGVIAEYPELGIVEIARPVGVVAAITPSTNPAATPANNIINALKCRNAIIVAPSPKGMSTSALLLKFIHTELHRTGMPAAMAASLVQMLPAPVSKESSHALMMQADLVVATGSQANVRAAYRSGTPAFGVGAGNVASIIDESADLAEAVAKIIQSKTFDNATSCSAENSIVVVNSVYNATLAEFSKRGGVLLDSIEKAQLQAAMWPNGRLASVMTAQSAALTANRAGLLRTALGNAKVLLVEEDGWGEGHPYSGEKLSPVLTVYRARDFQHAGEIVSCIYEYMGAGHSVSLHSTIPERELELGLHLPVSRVIVNQAHSAATGGNFNNGLPFSLSMGCGTWGGNNFSTNMNYTHYMNVTRISRPIAEHIPSDEEIFGSYFKRYGR